MSGGVVNFSELSNFDLGQMRNEVLDVQRNYKYNFKSPGWSSIPLRSLNGEIKFGISDACGEHLSNNYNMFQNTSASSLTPYLMKTMEKIAGNGKLLKARLLKLNAQSKIGQHQDIFIGDGTKKVIRYHIPIFTNPEVVFTVGGRFYKLEAGYLYSVDTSLPHSVENLGSTDRVHLVFDVVSS